MAALDNDGDVEHVQGSGKKPYELKNIGGVLSCSCVAWRMQSLPIDRRTCKHIRLLRGTAVEDARVGGGTALVNVAAIMGAGATLPDMGGFPDPERERITARAASQGRKLRQDEKAKLNGPKILLAHPFEDFPDLDPADWWVSEKLDGVRALWTGSEFISRQGNVFQAPAYFKERLPSHQLDGELYMGRRAFQKTISVVKRQDGGEQWRNVTYVVFDAPHLDIPFEERMQFLDDLWVKTKPPFMRVHTHSRVQSRKHLLEELRRYEDLGAEGLMIRKPGSLYEKGRSDTLLKVKPWKDMEGQVLAYEAGKGRHKGRVGGLIVRTGAGIVFNIGTGLSDEERRNPPPIGSTITFRYMDVTDGGVPKGASFLRVRPEE